MKPWDSEEKPKIIFTGTKLPKIDGNAFVGMLSGVNCIYPCNWTTTPTGTYGASVWDIEWIASHDLVHYPAQNATEETPGWIDHWKCSICGNLFLDENGEQPTTEAEIVERVPGRYVITYENMEGIENPNPTAWRTTEELILKSPVRTGYFFLGWSQDPTLWNPRTKTGKRF